MMSNEINKKFLIEETKKLLSKLGDSDISPSAYDTAWVARIQDEKDPSKPMFPQCLEWVLKNQKKDGSWGAEIEYFHDRIICTLSSVLTLNKYNYKRIYQDEIDKGERYIESNISNLKKDAYPTVAFELIFPVMIQEAWDNNLCLNYIFSDIDKYIQERKKKVKKIKEKVYKEPTSILHSIEGFGNDLDAVRVEKFQSSNGSFALSPAATAYMLIKLKKNNSKAVKYLEQLLKRFNGCVPVVWPFDIFERNWTLDFMESQLDLNLIKPHLDYIYKYWDMDKGISWSRFFSATDLDNTSASFGLLNGNKYDVDENVFDYYKSGEKYVCYEGEIHDSVSHHASLLEALGHFSNEKKKHEIKEIISYIKSKEDEGYWFDKWHSSPYYSTYKVVKSFVNLTSNYDFKKTLLRIEESQKDDGSWGWLGKEGNIEETSYCLQILKKLNQVNSESFKSGRGYLRKNFLQNNHESLWIEKCLYCPKNIVKSLSISCEIDMEN